jgi:hypothetical protein
MKLKNRMSNDRPEQSCICDEWGAFVKPTIGYIAVPVEVHFRREMGTRRLGGSRQHASDGTTHLIAKLLHGSCRRQLEYTVIGGILNRDPERRRTDA